MLDVRGFTYGFVLGGISMFFLDPERGPARRTRLRVASRRLVREARYYLQVGTRDLENRTRGMAARARGRLRSKNEELSEDVLVARVRARLGRVTAHAQAIEVRFKEGNEIELKGPALVHEHDRIVRAAARVRGVESIDDDLVVYEDGDGVPGLEAVESEPFGAGWPSSFRAGGRFPPAANLLIGASVAILLVTPFAPVLGRTLLLAALRSLLEGAAPQLRRRIVGRVERVGAQIGNSGDDPRRERAEQSGAPT